MKKQKRLLIARNLFIFFIFIAFAIIIVNEKASGIFIPKIEEKMNNYLKENYQNIEKDFQKNKVTYKNAVYEMKVSSKNNSHHCFYITYSNNKIKDTYKKDYLEGEQILNYTKENLQKNIEKITNNKVEIIITNKLNNYTKAVQEQIINNKDLLQLKFYIIKQELELTSWKKEDITKAITETISNYQKNNITPKSYTLTITNKKDITESIEISNLTNDFLKNPKQEEIINDIINDNNSSLLKENKIKYKYLN